MSMLKKIEQDWIRKKCLLSLTSSTLKSVSLIFVLGHAGVKGNERADMLAGGAIVQLPKGQIRHS
jgi:ribonuclease HI